MQASLIVADKRITLWVMGNGDVLESGDGVLGEQIYLWGL